MSQHDYVLDNQAGAAFRADLNLALLALVGASNGTSEPATMYAYMLWFDTTNDLLKMRNAANDAWVTLASLVGNTWKPYRSGTALGTAATRTVGTGALAHLPDVEDVQNQQGIYLADTGVADAYAITLIPAIGGYVEGQRFVVKAVNACTGASTLNVNGKGAGAIVWPDGSAMGPGDILAGQRFEVVRTATNFQRTDGGNVATNAQAIAGTNNTRRMTPLRTDEALENRIASGGILQADIGSAQVGQGELNTAIGEVSFVVSSGSAGGYSHAVLAGGEYGFYPQIKISAAQSNDKYWQIGNYNNASPTTSYITRITFWGEDVGFIGGYTMYAQQRYIQASPPYDMGDGDVFSFIFAIVNNGTGLIESMYHAADPPWANNGPTNIRPDRVDPVTGKKYKTILTVAGRASPANLMTDPLVEGHEIEVDAAFKNSDMNLIPHPFQGNDMTGKTVVLIDPMSAIVERLENLKNAGGDVSEFFSGGYVKIGNTELNRGRPADVMSVSIAMK